MKILAVCLLLLICIVVFLIKQADGFEDGPTGAFNIVKGTRVTSGGTGYEMMPPFTPKATGVTFSSWFVLTGSAIPNDWSRIFDMALTTPSPTTAIVLAIHGGKLRCYQSVAGTVPDHINFGGNTALALHTMYHVAWTINASGQHTLYLNGTVDGTGNKVLTLQSFPHFFLGKSNWIHDPYPNMTIYDFRMFDRALTAAEVTSSVATTRPTPASMIGPQGPAGPAGAQGAVGPAGPVGPVGPVGAQGIVGPAGPVGAQGPAGSAKAQGPAGPMGPMGPEGKMGKMGPMGPEGKMGKMGPMGPMGPVGKISTIGQISSEGDMNAMGQMSQMGQMGQMSPEGKMNATGSVITEQDDDQRSLMLSNIQQKIKKYFKDRNDLAKNNTANDNTPSSSQGREYSRSTYKK
jgi:hypothetical protein